MFNSVKNMLNKVFGRAAPVVFIKEFLNSPATVGAVYPSSKKLAKNIASEVQLTSENEVVVELGPGTGIITTALIKQGISPKQIIAIEKSSQLVAYLKKNYPEVTVIEGDAAHLDDILSQFKNKKVKCIISSLPFRSIPDHVIDLIAPQLVKAVNNGAKFVQFSYSLYKKQPEYFSAMQLSKTSMVWLNIPPARVSVFTGEKKRS